VRIWLFTPDLRLHSVSPQVNSTFILPASPTTTLVPVARGLVRLTMPAPGRPGHATQHLEPDTSLGRHVTTEGSGWAKALDGRVLVDLDHPGGYDYHIVVAGHPSVRYGNQHFAEPAAVAGDSLWFVNGLKLVRLNSDLKPTTPGFVTADKATREVTDVWSAGGTIWVATVAAKHGLFCFPAQSQDGPVVSLHVPGYPWALTAAGQTVYVLTSKRAGQGPKKLTSYQVPPACR
jgi:hypothetical protein